MHFNKCQTNKKRLTLFVV
uniref:Uncharacterized protein n=1 Tax=Rhizophora mucronata TaxID=61149 RepID=A0A2P2QHQ7_RHIMU